MLLKDEGHSQMGWLQSLWWGERAAVGPAGDAIGQDQRLQICMFMAVYMGPGLSSGSDILAAQVRGQ